VFVVFVVWCWGAKASGGVVSAEEGKAQRSMNDEAVQVLGEHRPQAGDV
jgi:hypothetical protein